MQQQERRGGSGPHDMENRIRGVNPRNPHRWLEPSNAPWPFPRCDYSVFERKPVRDLDSGSHRENASKQESNAFSVLIRIEPKSFGLANSCPERLVWPAILA